MGVVTGTGGVFCFVLDVRHKISDSSNFAHTVIIV